MITNPLRTTIKKPERKKMVLFLWLCSSLFLATARFVLAKAGIVDGLFREVTLYLIACIPFIYLLTGLSGTNTRIPNAFMFFGGLFLSVVIVFFLSLLFNPQLSNFYFRKDYGLWPVFRPDGAIFAFLLFSLFDDPKDLREILTKAAYVLFFFQVVVVFLPAFRRGYWIDIAPNGSEMHIRYSLSFGYDMLFLFIVFFLEGLRKHKIIHFSLAIVCIILMITNGGRGAIVVLVLSIAVLLVSNIIDRKTSVPKKALLISGIVILFLVYCFFFDEIIAFLLKFVTSHNINSRSIEMILNGSFLGTNGSDRIWAVVIEAIKEGGPFGYGLFGDRPFVAPIHVAGYSHNLFLELLVSFGVIGAGIIIYIISDTIKMLFFCKDPEWKTVYFILFSCSCKLLLSFSLWYTWEFWAAAAVAYKYKTTNKRSNRLVRCDT